MRTSRIKKLYTYLFENSGKEVQANKVALVVAFIIPNSLIVSMDSLGSDFISRGKLILIMSKKARLLNCISINISL